MIRNIALSEMGMCLSYAMDLVSPVVVDHHRRVAYIALSLAEELKLPPDERDRVVLAAIVHDIGAFSMKERIKALQFEFEAPMPHAEVGYHLLSDFEPMSGVAEIVRRHHVSWNFGKGLKIEDAEVPMFSHLLHLADRIAVLINPAADIFRQRDVICSRILKRSGDTFVPEYVDAFMRLSQREYFWLDAVSESIMNIILSRPMRGSLSLDFEKFISLARLFAKIIDFRSHFTATHSGGVAAIAVVLAQASGMTEAECLNMKIAGYLHDLGKLSIPVEILEKPGRLTDEEFDIVRRHTYYTFRIIEHVKGLEEINEWASFHHERLDGNGYPFHRDLRSLSPGSRIMAVADVFTALTEDRPYRKGMSKEMTVSTIRQMVDEKALDGDIVSALFADYEGINDVRIEAQKEEAADYRDFLSRFSSMTEHPSSLSDRAKTTPLVPD